MPQINKASSPNNLLPSDTKGNQRSFRAVSLVDQIPETLKDDILTGSLKSGDQLLEDQLKNEFGISEHL